MSADAARVAREIVDWRRRVFALYARVRAESAPARGHELWRRGRDELMAGHPASPLPPDARVRFGGLPIADYDPRWRFELSVAEAEGARWEAQTATDGMVGFERVGTVAVPEVGSLDVWRLTSYGGGLFVPVRDGLAGMPEGTYGGGRYLLDTIKGADLGDGAGGRIVLDFNFAYNPSCAYDPAWACPLPPAGNVVTTAIPVGERHPSYR